MSDYKNIFVQNKNVLCKPPVSTNETRQAGKLNVKVANKLELVKLEFIQKPHNMIGKYAYVRAANQPYLLAAYTGDFGNGPEQFVIVPENDIVYTELE